MQTVYLYKKQKSKIIPHPNISSRATTAWSLGGDGRGVALLRPPRAGYTGHGKGEMIIMTDKYHADQ